MDEGWFKLPHLAQVRLDCTLGLVEAAQLLCIEQIMCTGQTSRHPHTHATARLWGRAILVDKGDKQSQS